MTGLVFAAFDQNAIHGHQEKNETDRRLNRLGV